MSVKKLLYIFSAAPYSNAKGQEALDAVLIGAAFEQTVSVLFLHDGVFQIRANQNTTDSDLKQFTKAYRALNDFGIENVYAHDLALTSRGLNVDQLMVEVDILSTDDIRNLISAQDKVFTF